MKYLIYSQPTLDALLAVYHGRYAIQFTSRQANKTGRFEYVIWDEDMKWTISGFLDCHVTVMSTGGTNA